MKRGPCTCRAKRYIVTLAYITLWYVHVPRYVQVPRTDIPWYVLVPHSMVIYLYERSTCRHVRLNALNVLHIPRPLFIAPFFTKILLLVPHEQGTLKLNFASKKVGSQWPYIKENDADMRHAHLFKWHPPKDTPKTGTSNLDGNTFLLILLCNCTRTWW